MPFGSLRQPNTPYPISYLMNLLKVLIVVDPVTGFGNTVIAELSTDGIGTGRIYVEDMASMVQGAFPAVQITSGEQDTGLAGGPRGYSTMSKVVVTYYDKWDRNPLSIDAIHTNIRDDLERIKANIESNRGLAYQGSNHAMSVFRLLIGAYENQELESQLPGVTLVKCSLTLSINSLPYDS